MILADFLHLLFGIFNFQKDEFAEIQANFTGQKKRAADEKSAARMLKSLIHP